MKKSTLLNRQLSYEIACLGHTDCITVCDAGLPIPKECPVVDLALTKGLPSFLDTLETMASEMMIERVVIAKEILEHNPKIHLALQTWLKKLGENQSRPISIEYTTHQQFKHLSQQSRAFVRTGECSPFANIILYSGVTF